MIRTGIPSGLAALLVAAAATATVIGPASGAQRDEAAARGATYIAERQEASGTFFSPDTASDTAAEAVLALVAGGITGEPVDRALDYIRDRGPAGADERAGAAGRIAMGVAAAEHDPRDFGGVDYAEKIRAHYDQTTGSYDTNLYANTLAILGLSAAGVDPPEGAIRYVRANQCADGGFSWAPGCAGAPGVDTTALTLSALLAAGVPSDDLAPARARDWLVAARNDEGGFGYAQAQPTNGNSTGLALSAIGALGEEPTAAPWADGSGNPLDALLDLQTPSGGFKYLASEDGPNDYTTVQAVPGAAGVSSPLLPETEEDTDRASGSSETPDPTSVPAGGGEEPGTTPSDPTSPPDDDPVPTPAADDADAAVRAAGPSPTPETPSGATFGSGEHRAGLIVRGEDGELQRMCVFFDADEITGLELLRRADLDLVVDDFEGQGKSICGIGPHGCGGGEDCFCGYPTFWGYWIRGHGDETWRFSKLGVSDRTVSDGDADAWIWGEDGEPPPPDDLDIEELCPAAGPETNTATAAPESTPEPEGGGVNAVALGGIGALLGASGAALAVRRRWMS